MKPKGSEFDATDYKSEEKMSKYLTTMLVCLLLLPAPLHAQDDAAIYTVTFASTWSQQTHPHPNGAGQFPVNAHFSSLIGATHNISATFWADGALASPGIESMAETGGTGALRAEMIRAGANVQTILSGPGLASTPGAVAPLLFSATRDYPLVTLVTMIAPSPDWFVGVHSLALLDAQGQWRDQVVVTLVPYDAGSDDGADYAAADVEPTPHQSIADVSGSAPFSGEPIGTFTFTRLQQIYLPLVADD